MSSTRHSVTSGEPSHSHSRPELGGSDHLGLGLLVAAVCPLDPDAAGMKHLELLDLRAGGDVKLVACAPSLSGTLRESAQERGHGRFSSRANDAAGVEGVAHLAIE